MEEYSSRTMDIQNGNTRSDAQAMVASSWSAQLIMTTVEMHYVDVQPLFVPFFFFNHGVIESQSPPGVLPQLCLLGMDVCRG